MLIVEKIYSIKPCWITLMKNNSLLTLSHRWKKVTEITEVGKTYRIAFPGRNTEIYFIFLTIKTLKINLSRRRRSMTDCFFNVPVTKRCQLLPKNSRCYLDSAVSNDKKDQITKRGKKKEKCQYRMKKLIHAALTKLIKNCQYQWSGEGKNELTCHGIKFEYFRKKILKQETTRRARRRVGGRKTQRGQRTQRRKEKGEKKSFRNQVKTLTRTVMAGTIRKSVNCRKERSWETEIDKRYPSGNLF